ncbi:MAG: transposase [Chloroflexales bacterium]
MREVAYLLPTLPCDRCQQAAARFSTAERLAIDLDLDQPTLLLVTVSVHYCVACRHYFRAQPPFLRPDAVYTNRVVATAVAAVFEDRMAMRRVPARLARDYWIRPSEASVRQWCRAAQAHLDFASDYQPWVVQGFSGILCIDEVYQGKLALLVAVDPAAPDGDRLVGYQLIQGAVDAPAVERFLGELQQAGIAPAEVITDGSSLYPSVLAKLWPAAAHQLCLFHETRHVTRAALELIQALRRSLPKPPAKPGRGWGGRLRASPPTDNPDDPAYQRWHLRQATRQAGIAQVHALSRQGLAHYAIARQLGLNRRTVKAWLAEAPPADVPADLAQNWQERRLPSASLMRRQAHEATLETIRQLADQGLSYVAIAQQVGLHRVTVSAWLKQDASSTASPVVVEDEPSSARQAADGEAAAQELPPPPWQDWDEVRAVREALREHRFLLLRRPKHLSEIQQAQVDGLLASPAGQSLQVARRFVTEWYLLWHRPDGQRRTLNDAREQFSAWSNDAAFAAITGLRQVQERMRAQFEHVSAFLQQPSWEATNNGAERFGRAFRHRQAPHFTLRNQEAIVGSITMMACHQKAVATAPASGDRARSGRGRRPRSQENHRAAA